ncbi:hypothetical protein N7G274_007421 [Stereocaulon virgatum]|uniref:Uncharacterized protein n=1 Tax=Stereocaulon virgatum TaxID=373712 RepID=A0ABR4A2Y5_9LECA
MSNTELAQDPEISDEYIEDLLDDLDQPTGNQEKAPDHSNALGSEGAATNSSEGATTNSTEAAVSEEGSVRTPPPSGQSDAPQLAGMPSNQASGESNIDQQQSNNPTDDRSMSGTATTQQPNNNNNTQGTQLPPKVTLRRSSRNKKKIWQYIHGIRQNHCLIGGLVHSPLCN